MQWEILCTAGCVTSEPVISQGLGPQLLGNVVIFLYERQVESS